MKLFLVLLFVGCVSASFQDALEKASNDAVHSFMQGVEEAQPLHIALGIENNDAVQRLERDVKDELKSRLTKLFEETLEKINDAMNRGQKVNEKALEMLKALKDKMDELQVDESGIEAFEKQVNAHLQDLLRKMNILTKRSIDEDPMYSVFEDLSFRNFFLRVKQMILEKMDVSNVKHGLAKAVGQVSQSLCEWLTNKGKEKVINFFDRVLEADENPEKRSVQEYFEDLEIEFKRKIQLFREWLKSIIEKGFLKSKNEVENVRSLAEKRSVEEYLELLKKDFKERLEFFEKWLKHVVDQLTNKTKNQTEKRSVEEYLELLKKDFQERINFLKNWLKHVLEQISNKTKNQTEKRSVEEYLELVKKDFKERLEFFKKWLKHVLDQITSKSKNQVEKRSLQEYVELLDVEFQKKLDFYKNWLKNMVEKSFDVSKTKIENLRNLAREILNKTKDMSKEVAEEALEFLRQYKEELGYMYEIVRRRIMSKISEYTD